MLRTGPHCGGPPRRSVAHVLSGRKNYAYRLVDCPCARCGVFVFRPAHYSDRAFLSGMIAHHEGAVDMAKVFLATPKKDQDPQVTAWADDVIKVQEKEIAEMKDLLKPLGGIEESAYAPMKKAMQHMLEEGKNLGANMRFVELMLPHHAMALEMSVPALLGSNNPQILNLAENIIISQAKEMRQFKAWIAEHHKK